MAEAEQRELDKVNRELAEVEAQLEALVDRQNVLMEKRDDLKAIIDLSKDETSKKVAETDWNSSVFLWSKKLWSTLQSVFQLKELRPHQLPTMNVTMSGHDCILIMPTGGGKSLCYQLPALISEGVTLVVSPLVSLMEDQLMALRNLNIPAKMMSANSTRQEVNETLKEMTEPGHPLKLLYVTPEKLAKSKRFMSKLEKMYSMKRFARLAIDEVHCCSQWGHDFRPDYKFLGIMKRQFPKVPILGLTATSTTRVTYDVQKILEITGCMVLKASFNRPNLKYEVLPKPSSAKESVDELESLIKSRYKGKSGIIYCISIKDSEDIAKDLRSRGIKAGCYHAQLEAKDRSRVHRAWGTNEIQVVVATVAFGMGIDKPDVRYVIHYSVSKSMENFYQESGRAGRDDLPSDCILYFRFADMFRQSTMVFTEKTGLTNLYGMMAYCIDAHRCRRALIAQHFGETWDKSDCLKMCDNCIREPVNVKKKDITKHCADLYKILDQAQEKEQRITALKLVEAWIGKGAPNLRVASVPVPSMSREMCERIITYLIIEGYFREDFHFTPYSTISYLLPGIKSSVVRSGNHTIEIEVAKRGTGGCGGGLDSPSKTLSTLSPAVTTKSSSPTTAKAGCSSSSSSSSASSSTKPSVVKSNTNSTTKKPSDAERESVVTAASPDKKDTKDKKKDRKKDKKDVPKSSSSVDFLGSLMKGMNETLGTKKKRYVDLTEDEPTSKKPKNKNKDVPITID